jgi:hypothetical protein
MRVSRARISGSMLSRWGARWVIITKAMPRSVGMALNRCSSASTAPGGGAYANDGKLPIHRLPRRQEGERLPVTGGL